MKKRQGFAIVTALGLLMILMIIVAIVSTTSVAESKQGQMSIQMAQARAIADAGDVFATAAIRGTTGQNAIGDILTPLINSNVNPGAQWAISSSQWQSIAPQLEQTLNANFGSLSNDDLDNLGSATMIYTVSNFRGSQRTPSTQIYMADYTVISTGTTEKAIRRVENKGVFEIRMGFTPLARFLFLVDDAAGRGGFFPTGTIFNGPVHANSNWGFLGQPQFLSDISTSTNCAWYWRSNPWSRICLDANSRPPHTVPVFANGFQRGVPPVQLPTSAVSQQRVALGLNTDTTTTPSRQAICTQLGVSCNNNNVPDGVYVVNDGSNISGGIYIEGDLDELTMDASARNGTQKYTFVQDNVTYEVTLDYNNNTTTIDRTPDPAPPADPNVPTPPEPRVYQGLANGPVNSVTGATGQIYVNGEIKDLNAPNRTGAVNPPSGQAGNHPPSDNIPPALAIETQLNITATEEVRLTSDIVYECDPTMLSNNSYLNSHPRCNIGTNNTLPTILGVMSLDKDIEMDLALPNDPYLWGSYLAGDNGRGLTVENYNTRPAQGTMRIFGGLLQSTDQLRGRWGYSGLRNGFVETFDFDNRLANGALAPPNFPVSGGFSYTGTNPAQLSYKEF